MGTYPSTTKSISITKNSEGGGEVLNPINENEFKNKFIQ